MRRRPELLWELPIHPALISGVFLMAIECIASVYRKMAQFTGTAQLRISRTDGRFLIPQSVAPWKRCMFINLTGSSYCYYGEIDVSSCYILS